MRACAVGAFAVRACILNLFTVCLYSRYILFNNNIYKYPALHPALNNPCHPPPPPTHPPHPSQPPPPPPHTHTPLHHAPPQPPPHHYPPPPSTPASRPHPCFVTIVFDLLFHIIIVIVCCKTSRLPWLRLNISAEPMALFKDRLSLRNHVVTKSYQPVL